MSQSLSTTHKHKQLDCYSTVILETSSLRLFPPELEGKALPNLVNPEEQGSNLPFGPK